MASCNVNTLLSTGKSFQALDDQSLRLALISSLKTILATLSPGTVVTPAAVMSRGVQFQSLDDQGLRNCIFRSGCILGGG